MEYEYTISEQDYIDFNKYAMNNSKSGRQVGILFRIIVPILLLIVLILSVISEADPLFITVAGCWYAIVAVLWVIFSPKLMDYNIKRTIKRMKRDGKLPYSPKGKLVFGEEVIEDIAETTEMKIKYEAIVKVCSSENTIYIFTGAMQALILPCTAFSNAQEKEELLQFLRTKVSTEYKFIG